MAPIPIRRHAGPDARALRYAELGGDGGGDAADGARGVRGVVAGPPSSGQLGQYFAESADGERAWNSRH